MEIHEISLGSARRLLAVFLLVLAAFEAAYCTNERLFTVGKEVKRNDTGQRAKDGLTRDA